MHRGERERDGKDTEEEEKQQSETKKAMVKISTKDDTDTTPLTQTSIK